MPTEWMSARQLTAICRIFTDGDNIPPRDQIQDLLDSGCLADLRDANFRGNHDSLPKFRNDIRKVCGHAPLEVGGEANPTSCTSPTLDEIESLLFKTLDMLRPENRYPGLASWGLLFVERLKEVKKMLDKMFPDE